MANNKKSDVIASISESFSKVRERFGEDVAVDFIILYDEKVTREDEDGEEYETTEEKDRAYSISLYDDCYRLRDYKMPELQTIRHRIKDLTELAVYIGDKQNNRTEKFSCKWNKFSQQLDITPTVETTGVVDLGKFDPDLLGDLFSDNFDFTTPTIPTNEPTPTVIEPKPIKLAPTVIEPEPAPIPAKVESISEPTPIPAEREEAQASIFESLDFPVFLGQNNDETKLIKKPANVTSADLMAVLDAWLQATGQKNEFIEALKQSKKLGHNSLVVYPYPAVEFYINSGGQLTKKIVRSETIAQITNRPGTIIQRTGRASSPLYCNLYYISPIRAKDDKGNVYLMQTYLKRTHGQFATSWEQRSHKVAWFDGGNLHYYKELKQQHQYDLIAEHQLLPMIDNEGRAVDAGGKDSDREFLYPDLKPGQINIFPDLSIHKIAIEHLSPSHNGLFETTKDTRQFDKANQKPTDKEEAYRTSEKALIKPRVFHGFDHPNLKPKKPLVAEKTERKIPKPTRLDGARTNDHEYQLKAIIGNVPMLLTFKKSDHLWDVIALPVKVSPYHLAVYLSDKVGSTELISYIRKHQEDLALNLAKVEVQIEEILEQITNLPDSDHFLPRSRSLQTKIDSLAKVCEDIREINESLEQLMLNIKSHRYPRRIDVLESTKHIQSVLAVENIKPESSYTDNYYRWHNIGSLRILEQVEQEKPTYRLTILGDEKDTRRSNIPLVMNWLRRVPLVLQNHFGTSYPTNEEIKDHLMTIYPFYKRKLKEGDKIDKSYTNLEADMIIRTKGRLTIDIYFNGQLQTSQLLSITKPMGDNLRQGKIPVKISSSVEIKSLETLTHLLRCDDYKQTFAAQNHLNKLVQKFVDSNIKLFTIQQEEKIVSRVAIKDLLGFSRESKGFPQIVKQYRQFITPFTVDSDVQLGNMVNLLTLETFDRHDTQTLFDAMVANWKKWNRGEYVKVAGFDLQCRNPGDLICNVFHTVKHNQDRSQLVWGAFIDELYKLSNIPVGFRTVEGVLLTPWSLHPTDKKTWEHRIRVQLTDIISVGQRERLEKVEELLKNEKTREEGKKLRDKIRGASVEAWLQMSIDDLYSMLFEVRPNWESLVHNNVLSHLSALHSALEIAEKV